MWFMAEIVGLLEEVSAWFYEAYRRVHGWVYPFNLLASPLLYISYAFYYLMDYFSQFNDWLTWAAGRLGQILDISAITSYFKTWINYAVMAYSWVFYAVSNVTDIVGTWWSSAQYIVQSWIDNARALLQSQINAINTLLANLQVLWQQFVDWMPSLSEIIAWFTNWWSKVLAQIIAWGALTALQIGNLIDSAFNLRESFWAGWQDIRDTVFEFFNDPLEWLWARFTDWFLGPEE